MSDRGAGGGKQGGYEITHSLQPTPTSGSLQAERLLKITAAIANAVSHAEVFEALVDHVASAVGASSAGLWLVDEDGQTARLAHARGYSAASLPVLSVVSLNGRPSLPVIESIHQGEPVWFASQAALLARYPNLGTVVSEARNYRISCLPLLAQNRVLGALALTVEEPGEVSEEEQRFLLLVAGYASQAIERLRLFEAERRSRLEASAAANRLEILSHASRAFVASSLDREAWLQKIASELMTLLGSCINISLIEPNGLLRLMAVQHPDPEAQELLSALSATNSIKVGEGVTGVLVATGESILLPKVDPEMLQAHAAPPYRSFLARFPVYAMIGAALKVRGQIIGAVTAARCREGETYTTGDLRLLEDLADRAAVALENSRLYQEALDARTRAEQLYGFAQAVVVADQLEIILDAAANAIEGALGTKRSAILTFDQAGVMRFRSWRNLSEVYRQAVEGHSPWPRDAVAPEPLLVPDVELDPPLAPYLPLLRAEGIGSLAFIPLVTNGRLLGKFMVYYDQPRSFLPHEVGTARTIANHLASVITRFTLVAKLKETLRENELFAGILAHDLRNPLSAIVTAAQLVLRRADDDKTRKPLHRILSSGERMSRMIDQLLDFTRARLGGGLQLQKRKADLRQLAAQTLEEVELTNSEWAFRLESTGDLQGEWDPDRMAQVFSNLAVNAVQHGSPERPLSFRLDGSKEHTIEVEIHNSGAISPQLLPVLFEPFRNAQYRHSSQGLGLGLFITQQIILAHGGEIRVTSSEAEGTTFKIKLPRAASLLLSLPEPPQLTSGESPESTTPSKPEPKEESQDNNPSKGNPILIVDDDLDIREALAELLEHRGFSVITAANGAQALALLQRERVFPAVILLDVMMPVMDGYRFLEEQRKDPLLARIPVALMTAGHSVERARLDERLQVIPKPIKVPQLMSTLEQLQQKQTT